ncbi:hypothetical protein ASPCAL05217 [Aspergillus calidoustus]|uniref:Uncharacterized protein n=1 Tax=Aspergillus calidoustus TaxID=454130 RepID=A0A0U4Z351_ASPCI|nr:hypothetical protein ASPCAL05217 [Aspergillus calidoustus]
MDHPSTSRKRQLSQDSQDTPPQKRDQREGGRADAEQRTGQTARGSQGPCAKWCTLRDDGGYTIDETIIRNHLTPDARDGPVLIRDILSGYAIGGAISPLIFEHASEDDGESVWFRSLPYFEGLIADGAAGKQRYRDLSQNRKWIVAAGVRDLYLAAWKGHADEREQRILHGMVEVIGQPIETASIDGMQVSCCPSASHKVLKFIENLDQKIDVLSVVFFAQILETPRLFAVFVDPLELSYHNFENIVPLDRWMEAHGGNLELSFTPPKRPSFLHDILTCELDGESVSLLKELSSLDLYTQPLNKEARGGQRFIFHSALLSKALTSAIRNSGILANLTDGSLAPAFEFVNYVFRCNRFSPGDTRFANHLDTPYYDSERSHVSKYTLLIYLSSGTGNPALRVDNVDLEEIEEFTCVIFDQRLHHEGQPFLSRDKVFLRTELIFKDDTLIHDTRIAPLFSTACYLTGQDVFGEELGKYAHECFERANSLHWALEQDTSAPDKAPLYLHKTFRTAQFITNGYDYYFKRTPDPDASMTPADCAILAVLDYLNCKITTRPFRTLCDTKPLRATLSSTSDIWRLFDADDEPIPLTSTRPAISRLTTSDITPLIRTHPNEPFIRRRWEGVSPDADDDEYEESHPPCCIFHCWQTFDAWRDPDVRTDYRKCWAYTRDRLFGVPLVILGHEVFINESQILVQDDKIFVLRGSGPGSETAHGALPPLNFAACWGNCLPSITIVVDGEVQTPELLIPPIVFYESEDGWHLVLDLFRNDWMVSVDEDKAVPLPVITNDVPEEGFYGEFWDRVEVGSDGVREMEEDDDDGWGEFVWPDLDEGEGASEGSEDAESDPDSDVGGSSVSSVTI